MLTTLALKHRLGVLLCVNGTGILNSWLQKNVGTTKLSYAEMNEEASQIPIGSQGLAIIPFGNGAERVIENRNTGCQISNLNFNLHTQLMFTGPLRKVLLSHSNMVWISCRTYGINALPYPGRQKPICF